MAKTKISEWSTTPASNTDIDGINIAEGCAPSGINDAIRDLMSQVRSWQSGASGDPFNGPMNGTIGATTAYSGAFTTLSASGTTTLSGLTASTALALDASKNVVSVANTGSGSNVLATSPTLVTPALGTPSSATLTNATGLPISTGVSGLGTGVATALAVNVGSAGAPVVNGGALGTPSSGTVTNLTGTASININGTVGSTTPTTGAFTTTTVSTSETLSYGTANGVTYLNGSKVLTSGSALTFDGTTFEQSVAGLYPLISVASSANNAIFGFRMNNTGVSGVDWRIEQGRSAVGQFNISAPSVYASPLYVISSAGTFQYWSTTSGEQMRLTSTGLGIGTSSPAYKLDVAGTARTSNTTGNKVFYLGQSTPSGNDGASLEFQNSNSQTNWAIRSNYNVGGGLEFCPSSAAGGTSYTTPSMVISSSGNLGLGVTPSAWGIGKALQVNNASLMGYLNRLYANANTYFDGTGTGKYIASDYATSYQQVNGTHAWFNAPSGTAGNAISFTQAMTLDANGLLQVGATSPINSGAVTFASSGGTYNQLELCDTRAYSSTPNSSLGFAVKYNSAGSYTNMAAIVGTKENATDGNYSGALLFYTSLNGSGSAERARIDSSGNLLVGTTTNTPAQSNVSGFKVGGGQIECNGSNTQAAFFGRSNDGQVVRFYNAGSAAGNISNTSTVTTYNGTSDYRLKENIQPMEGGLEKILALKPVTYTWKNDGRLGQGFIAHELQEVIPDAVQGEKDAIDEDGNPEYQGIDPRMVVATLTAALQELNAKFDAYVASHP